MGLESFQPNNNIEKEEKQPVDHITVPGHHSPYVIGNRVSVIRSDKKMDYDWVLSEIEENDVKLVKSIGGEMKEKTVSRDDFVKQQILAGDRRSFARQLKSDDEDFTRTENFASEINLGKYLDQIKDEKIENEKDSKNFLERYGPDPKFLTPILYN